MGQVATYNGATESSIITVSPDGAVVCPTCPSIRERQALILHDELRAAASRRGGRVAVGLSAVADLSSACINVLVAVTKHCKGMGGSLVVFGVTPEIRKLFSITRIDRLLLIAKDEAEARRVLNGATEPPLRSLIRSLSRTLGPTPPTPSKRLPGDQAENAA